MRSINVLQMPVFKRAYKKLHSDQKIAVDQAIVDVMQNPNLGQAKKGDLNGVYSCYV